MQDLHMHLPNITPRLRLYTRMLKVFQKGRESKCNRRKIREHPGKYVDRLTTTNINQALDRLWSKDWEQINNNLLLKWFSLLLCIRYSLQNKSKLQFKDLHSFWIKWLVSKSIWYNYYSLWWITNENVLLKLYSIIIWSFKFCPKCLRS